MTSSLNNVDPTNCINLESQNGLDCPNLYFNRELSWIEFNARVLANACDTNLPLLEQLKFLSIFHNNLDEFYMVRVANLLRLYNSGAVTTAPDKLSPARQLAEIRKRVMPLLGQAYAHWKRNIHPQLVERGVNLVSYEELSDKQKKFLEGYFQTEIYPILTPQAIDPSHPFPTISNISLNFIIHLQGEKDKISRFARLRCPHDMSRFVFVPRNKEAKSYTSLGLQANLKDSDIVLLEDIIAEHLSSLFSGHKIVSYGLFRITRNTDIEIEEDEAADLLEAMKDLVNQRHFGNVVRLETTRGMSAELTSFLIEKLQLRPVQVQKVRGPLAFADMMQLYSINKHHLKDEPFTSYTHPMLGEDTIFETLSNEDILLHHPYDSFLPVVDFIRMASEDPAVIAIKQTLYRVGHDSPIVQALIAARRRGKQVTAVVELKARFDEERNITWAEELEKAGVNVVYGIVGMKVHAKLCLVVRREVSGVERYVHIGTGNYNVSSSKMYTDHGLITSNERICADITDVFNAITGYARKESYNEILASPTTMRKSLLECINTEAKKHLEFGNGEIILKCNQLVDKEIIQALYNASMDGVKISLIVRGICCLVPNTPGVSDNISVKSIVGRFLEHSRIYYFHNNGNSKIYIGSADLMPRNLDRRIEVCVPILQEKNRKKIREQLESQLRDNRQSWILQESGEYVRAQAPKGEQGYSTQESSIKACQKKK